MRPRIHRAVKKESRSLGSPPEQINPGSLNLSVNDSNIHSGVPATNPFGVTLDNYVLQAATRSVVIPRTALKLHRHLGISNSSRRPQTARHLSPAACFCWVLACCRLERFSAANYDANLKLERQSAAKADRENDRFPAFLSGCPTTTPSRSV